MAPDSAVRAGSPVRTALSSASAAPYRIAALALAASAAVAVVDPAHTHVPLCPLHATTGLQCPFCGTLRAVGALARGHPATALRDNLLFVAALPVLAWLWLDWLLRVRSGRPTRTAPRSVTVVLVVLTIGFAVVRNLPGATALRP